MNEEMNEQQHYLEQQEQQPKPTGYFQNNSEFAQKILGNEHIPEIIRQDLWVLFGKSSKLTFLTEEDVRNFMLQFELLRLTIIEELPKCAYTDELEKELIQISMEFEMNLNRSKGGKSMNERELLGVQSNAQWSDRGIGSAREIGFLSKLSGLFRGGK